MGPLPGPRDPAAGQKGFSGVKGGDPISRLRFGPLRSQPLFGVRANALLDNYSPYPIWPRESVLACSRVYSTLTLQTIETTRIFAS